MTVGVIALDAFFKPEDFFHAEGVAEFLFGLLAGEVGVAVGVEQDGFGGEQLAASVDLDGSAFEDHAALVAGEVEGVCDFSGDGVVEIPWAEFSAPCVELPVSDGDFVGDGVFDKDGAVVAAPDVVVGVVVEVEVGEIGMGAVTGGGDGAMGGSGGVDADLLVT